MRTKFIFLLLPQVHILDLAGADQAIHEAMDFGADFETEYCGISQEVVSTSGVPFGAVKHFAEVSFKKGDFLMVAGCAYSYLISPDFLNQKEQLISSTSKTEALQQEAEMDFFFIKENNTHIKIKVEDVLFIESMGDFSKIMVKDNKSHMVLISLKNLEKQLSPSKFMRVHKQFMVNLEQIVSISNTDLKLSNQQQIPVSSVHKQLLMDQFINKRTLSRFKD